MTPGQSRKLTGWRKKLFKELGRKCQICGFDGYLEIHHYIPVSEGGLTRADNLLILCEVCHSVLHGVNKKTFWDERRKSWIPEVNHAPMA